MESDASKDRGRDQLYSYNYYTKQILIHFIIEWMKHSMFETLISRSWVSMENLVICSLYGRVHATINLIKVSPFLFPLLLRPSWC